MANLPWAPASLLDWSSASHYNLKSVTEKEKKKYVNSNTLCFIVNSNINRGMGKPHTQNKHLYNSSKHP